MKKSLFLLEEAALVSCTRCGVRFQNNKMRCPICEHQREVHTSTINKTAHNDYRGETGHRDTQRQHDTTYNIENGAENGATYDTESGTELKEANAKKANIKKEIPKEIAEEESEETESEEPKEEESEETETPKRPPKKHSASHTSRDTAMRVSSKFNKKYRAKSDINAQQHTYPRAYVDEGHYARNDNQRVKEQHHVKRRVVIRQWRRIFTTILSLAFMIPTGTLFVIDALFGTGFATSMAVSAVLVCVWAVIVSALYLYARPTIAVTACIAIVLAYLFYLSRMLQGDGQWYIGLVLPLMVGMLLFVLCGMYIVRVLKTQIVKAVVVLFLIMCVVPYTELCLNLFLYGQLRLSWSIIVIVACAPLYFLLVYIHKHRDSFRELKKWFHV